MLIIQYSWYVVVMACEKRKKKKRRMNLLVVPFYIPKLSFGIVLASLFFFSAVAPTHHLLHQAAVTIQGHDDMHVGRAGELLIGRCCVSWYVWDSINLSIIWGLLSSIT